VEGGKKGLFLAGYFSEEGLWECVFYCEIVLEKWEPDCLDRYEDNFELHHLRPLDTWDRCERTFCWHSSKRVLGQKVYCGGVNRTTKRTRLLEDSLYKKLLNYLVKFVSRFSKWQNYTNVADSQNVRVLNISKKRPCLRPKHDLMAKRHWT